jgi:1-acyl-sn-glycerol-3-phosphate acyltransferase
MHATQTPHFVYALGFRATCQMLKLIGRPELYRFERIPTDGRMIFAANHVSYLDPFVIGVCVGREIHFMARHDLFVPILAPVLRAVNAFPVKRGEPDLGALRHALRVLSDGNALLLFPEGTRSSDAEIHAARSGVGFLARRSGAPVVPIYVNGLDRILARHQRTLRRDQLRVIFGEPRCYSRNDDTKAVANDVIEAIRALRSELETVSPSEYTRLA